MRWLKAGALHTVSASAHNIKRKGETFIRTFNLQLNQSAKGHDAAAILSTDPPCLVPEWGTASSEVLTFWTSSDPASGVVCPKRTRVFPGPENETRNDARAIRLPPRSDDAPPSL